MFRFFLLLISFYTVGVESSSAKTAGDFFKLPEQIAVAEAVSAGKGGLVKTLLNKGMDINQRGVDGMTFLIWAIINNSRDGFKALLDDGANPNLQMVNGNSVMSYGAMHEDPWYLDLALKCGGNPNLVDSVNTQTPIYQGITALRLRNVTALIEAGADLNFKDKRGRTPLIWAAMNNRYDIVYTMLEKGADPTIKNDNGYTILWPIHHLRTDPHSELYGWREKVINLLRSMKIDVDSGI